MEALNRAGSIFLRSILKRMKALGLNQSALARRMNVSRAYVSKVFAGDVNISFQTACRFAKALEMDFMPGLAPKKESGARQGVRGVVAAVFCALALACQAEVFTVPSWLPEDQRFEVSGTSNEIEQVEQTLAAMRDAFHPKLIAMMRHGDSATNGYPSAMGPTLEWIVHVSLPSATNETTYFESYRKPLTPSAFDFNLLTNRAARLSYLPPTVKLSLVFDDGKKDSISRAIPGVDYPGISYEDEGSTARALRLTLRAPGRKREFRVLLEAWPKTYREIEFQWIMSPVLVQVWERGRPDRVNLTACKGVRSLQNAIRQKLTSFIAFFAREKGSSIWGAPSFVYFSPDDFGRHSYGVSGAIDYIDYGSFRDVYKLDEKDRIIGFTRMLPGMVCGQDYSNEGEQLIETYPDDKPKVTRRVKYAVVDGKLTYETVEEDIHYKNGPMKLRSY